MLKITSFLLVLTLVGAGTLASAQESQPVRQKGYTLHFTSNDPALNADVKARMIRTFFEVYPRLAKEYNTKTLKEVTFLVDTAYKGVAATSDGRVVYSSHWLRIHPEDIDVVTHEVMHIVQDYGDTNGPGWLTEGIADYVRFKFGVDNQGAGWALPPYKEGQSYRNSYRITARFLHWLETKGHKGIVRKMDAHMRAHTYSDELWAKYTGKDLDGLWSQYVANPDI
ncbi:basic secretory protein-like protein [Arcticibacter sp. MXS-1]|uniref:basic secretory protein-like protein n=1 Tax=Arcticibacter sp. MXS-1 TaxID=3341726 RepID=UPI0035A82AB1